MCCGREHNVYSLWDPGWKDITYEGSSYQFFTEENKSSQKGEQEHTIHLKTYIAKNVFADISWAKATYMAKFNINGGG